MGFYVMSYFKLSLNSYQGNFLTLNIIVSGDVNTCKDDLKLSCDPTFTVCSRTFMLFWLRKTLCECWNVSVKFVCAPFWAFHLETFSFFLLEFLLFIPIFIFIYDDDTEIFYSWRHLLTPISHCAQHSPNWDIWLTLNFSYNFSTLFRSFSSSPSVYQSTFHTFFGHLLHYTDKKYVKMKER